MPSPDAQDPPAPAITIDLPDPGAGPDRDWTLSVPASGAVISLDDARDVPVQILVGADARAAVRKRLAAGRGGSDGALSASALDLRPVTRRVRVWPLGSRFEGDALFLRIAAREHPDLARSAMDRTVAWFLHIDPDERFPKWRKATTNDPSGGREGAGSVGRMLGPIRDKHAAGRAIDDLNDLFDLCRYHHLLVQAPDATACAYKELGKCPAPCDGSEPMDAYRARVREAIAFWDDPTGWRERTERGMGEAAAALDFERAARLKERLERSRALEGGAFAHAHARWAGGWLMLGAGVERGTVRALHASHRGIRVVGDVPAAADAGSAWGSLRPSLGEAVRAALGAAVPGADDRLAWDLLALACARVYERPGGSAKRERRSAGGRRGRGVSPEAAEGSEAGSDDSSTRRWTFGESLACVGPVEAGAGGGGVMGLCAVGGPTTTRSGDTVTVSISAGTAGAAGGPPLPLGTRVDLVDEPTEAFVKAWRRAGRALGDRRSPVRPEDGAESRPEDGTGRDPGPTPPPEDPDR
ncbi:MAG: UvrB/UvrC motif-containing protein [Phycisphaerales bacterium]